MTYHRNQYIINGRKTLKTYRELEQHRRSCMEKQSVLANFTILSLDTISLTTDESNNIWNKTITYVKEKLDCTCEAFAHWKKKHIFHC